jgi:hypothetical protein
MKRSDKHYLGKLCPKGHQYKNTGKSLLYKNGSSCVICKKDLMRERCKENHLNSVRVRAKKQNVPFLLNVDWLISEMPTHCPVLNIKLKRGSEDFDCSPSIDRLIPELGYVPSNCRIISQRANQIKSNASPEELRLVADWLESELNQPLFTNYYNQTILEKTVEES